MLDYYAETTGFFFIMAFQGLKRLLTQYEALTQWLKSVFLPHL